MYEAARQLMTQLQQQLPALKDASGWDALVKEYPSYATGHLGRTLAAPDGANYAHLTGLFVTKPLRLAAMLEPASTQWDSWLHEQLEQENGDFPATDNWQNLDASESMDPILEKDHGYAEDWSSQDDRDENGPDPEDFVPPEETPGKPELQDANFGTVDNEIAETGEDLIQDMLPGITESTVLQEIPASMPEVSEELPEPEISAIVEAAAEVHGKVASSPDEGMPKSEPVEATPAGEKPEPEMMGETSSQALKAAVDALNSAPTDEDFLFEPFHTVDYFASQGVQVPAELTADVSPQQLETKLKSFTQWLKVMKKLNYVPPVAKESDPVVDAQARASLDMKTIVTEAMAEVLIKQGKKDQAGHIYTKLMLLHPEKSTYFAARLNELKNK